MKSILITAILVISNEVGFSKTLTGYPWGTQLEEIAAKEKISEFQNDYLESNLRTWVKRNEAKNFSLYLNGESPVELSGVSYRKAYGFYKNRLFYTIHLTDELSFPKNWKWESDSTYQRIYGGKADGHMLIMKGRVGGTIFNEGGYSAVTESPSHLIEFQTCVGNISKPVHLQYVIFEFDNRKLKEFKRLDGFYRFSGAIKEALPDQFPFSRIISKEDLEGIE